MMLFFSPLPFYWLSRNTKSSVSKQQPYKFPSFTHFHRILLYANVQALNTSIHNILWCVTSKTKQKKTHFFLHLISYKLSEEQSKHPEALWRKAAGFQPGCSLIKGAPRSAWNDTWALNTPCNLQRSQGISSRVGLPDFSVEKYFNNPSIMSNCLQTPEKSSQNRGIYS